MTRLNSLLNDLKHFARFETALASVCLATPLVLIALDGWQVRGSISAYYSMTQNQWFYFLLTAAVMLFLVNAFVRVNHLYNFVLGLGLVLIVLFNHKDYVPLHWAGVGVFFLGNAVVIAFFSQGPKVGIKLAFIGVMVLSLVALFLPWWTLFWAEWLSMAAIGTHFLLDAASIENYNATPRGGGPSLRG